MIKSGLMSKQDVKRRLDSIFGEYSAFVVRPDDQKKFVQKSKLLENNFNSSKMLLDVKQTHVDNQSNSSSNNINSMIGQLVDISKPLSPVIFEQCDTKLTNGIEATLKHEDEFTNKIEKPGSDLDKIFKQISCVSPLLSPIATISSLVNEISNSVDNNIKQEINSNIDEDVLKNKLKRPNVDEVDSNLYETKRPKLLQNNTKDKNSSSIYSIKLRSNSLKKLSNKFPSQKENLLQTLLRRTYEIESAYLDKQRTDCLHEMREAMELVDKMRRKQSSIVNSLKLATGATSGTTDDIDTKIFSLKARMEKIKQGIEELVQRWMKIESLCGFSITGPFAIDNNNTSSPITNNSSSSFTNNNTFLNNSNNNIFGHSNSQLLSLFFFR